MSKIGNIVDPAYLHYEKIVTPHGIMHPNNSRLKWYDIARKDGLVSESMRNSAREFINREAGLTGVPVENELGFILLHKCGDNFYFLMLCTWCGNNELWKTVYYFDTEKMTDFAIFPLEEAHKATFCVWEMAVVTHESRAWIQYLISERRPTDEDKYLLDVLK